MNDDPTSDATPAEPHPAEPTSAAPAPAPDASDATSGGSSTAGDPVGGAGGDVTADDVTTDASADTGPDPDAAAGATDVPEAAAPAGTRWWRDELWYLVEILGLSGFAVAQTVLSPFGESPETFTAVGADSGQIVRFALIVAFVPALVLWVVCAPSRLLGRTPRLVAHAVVLGVLAAAAATVIARGAGAPTAGRVVAAVVAGAVVGLLRAREVVAARLFLRFTVPVPAMLAFLFLFSSPVAPLVRPADGAATDTSGIDRSVDRPPVVMILLDELPTASLLDGSGAIDANRFPNIARIADTSTWYRNHTTGAAATLQSLPILMTGRMPEDAAAERFPIHSNYPDNLFTLLGDAYELNVHEHVTELCPTSLCPEPSHDIDDEALELTVAPPEPTPDPVGNLLDQAWSLWRDEAWPLSDGYEAGYTLGGPGEVASQEVVTESLRAVSSIGEASGDQPVFDYVHLGLPHQPWYLLPSGRIHDAPEIPLGNEFVRYWPEGDSGLDLAQAGEARMQLQLQWADRAVGAMIDRLEAAGRWDDALVILTADHGFSFEPGTSARLASSSNQRSLAWAPLLVKLPNQRESAVDDAPVMALDVVPTVLDVLDIEAPWELDGRSLLDGPPPADRQRPFVIVEDTDFATTLGERVAVLDADGLTPLLTAGRPTEAGDRLAAWRYGRHGDLIGEDVDHLGVCPGTGPTVDIEVTEGWERLVAGRLSTSDPLPLWHQGTVDVDGTIDAVAAVDGRVVAWAVVDPSGAGGRIGFLFAEPLVAAPKGDPVYYEVLEGDCRLRPLGVD